MYVFVYADVPERAVVLVVVISGGVSVAKNDGTGGDEKFNGGVFSEAHGVEVAGPEVRAVEIASVKIFKMFSNITVHLVNSPSFLFTSRRACS